MKYLIAFLLYASLGLAQEEAPVEQGFKYRFGVFLTNSGKVSFDNARYTQTSPSADLTGTAEFALSSGYGILIEGESRPNPMGDFTGALRFGLEYELPREVKDSSFQSGATVVLGSYSRPPKISGTNAYFGAIVKRNQSFGTVGAHLFLPSLDITSSASVKLTGGIGYQIGFGHNITDKVSIELQYRINNVLMTETGSGYILNYGDGKLNDFRLFLKHSF